MAFKISDWNSFLDTINEKLQDPPGGCFPVSIIPQVTDPHKWSTGDIAAVRSKLIATCSEISFSIDLRLWKQEIIDEITEKLSEMWCNCTETDTIYEETTLDYISAPYEAGPRTPHPYTPSLSFCDGNIRNFSPVRCSGGRTCYFAHITMLSECFDDNRKLIEDEWNSNSDFYQAYTAYTDYINNWNALLITGSNIKEYQNGIDVFVAQIDSLIEAYEACISQPEPGDCSQYSDIICQLGKQVTEWQDLLDEEVTKFQEYYNDLNSTEASMEIAAESLMEMKVNWPSVFDVPGNENNIAQILGVFGEIDWVKLINPYDIDVLSGHSITTVSKAGENLPGAVIPILETTLVEEKTSNINRSLNTEWYITSAGRIFTPAVYHLFSIPTTVYFKQLQETVSHDCGPSGGPCEYVSPRVGGVDLIWVDFLHTGDRWFPRYRLEDLEAAIEAEWRGDESKIVKVWKSDLTEDHTDKTPEGENLDKLGLNKLCCRRHLLTHVDIE